MQVGVREVAMIAAVVKPCGFRRCRVGGLPMAGQDPPYVSLRVGCNVIAPRRRDGRCCALHPTKATRRRVRGEAHCNATEG